MLQRVLIALGVVALLCFTLASPSAAKVDTRADQADASRVARISTFDLGGTHPWVGRTPAPGEATPAPPTRVRPHRPVGSALSAEAGIGVGESVVLTFNDMQYGFPLGRQVAHYWNGEYGENLKVSVHFAYELASDTIPEAPGETPTLSGYNVYDASVAPEGLWPRGADAGCALQALDPNGTGKWVNIDMMHNGLAVMGAESHFYMDTLANGTPITDNIFYYQGLEFNCIYTDLLNTTSIDSTVYRAHWWDQSEGNYSVQPQVCTQWDGANTIVHVVIAEQDSHRASGVDYVDDGDSYYRVATYYRKVGDDDAAGTWSTGVIIDSILEVYATNGICLAASPVSGNVAISYSNPGYWGNQLDNRYDTDVYYRESSDYGLSWAPKVDITNYQNALAGNPAHFKGWVEAASLYTSNDDLHIIWTGTPTSADPYFDGFEWNDFDTDVYHWAKSTDEIVKVANGTFLNDDFLTGSMNTVHCGFGGQYAGYIAFLFLSECDGKLYSIWNQFHVKANEGDWRTDESLLSDCSLGGDRLSKANWEIMMSVADINSSSLWDPPRNLTNTFTPNCCVPGDMDPDCEGPCGSEYKPSVEKYGLDESGMDVYWPAATLVDPTPDGEPPYSGAFFLNAEYHDDIYPGPSGIIPDARAVNGIYTLNSEKWVRIACVEPIEASIISARPRNVEWPEWVQIGDVGHFPLTVINDGNVSLNVSEIGTAEATSSNPGWLSTSVTTPPDFVVPAGVNNTSTFDIVIDGSGFAATEWLDGEVWLKSDALNNDSISVPVHVLVAPDVEPVIWDTVTTHADMFDPYGFPEGDCIALAVGNHGELGFSGSGGVNLDFSASGNECGTRDRDAMYITSGTAFTIDADASGENAVLSTSFNHLNQAPAYGFDPIADLGSIRGGAIAMYDSVYTGRFVNRDTTIAMERTVIGPRDNPDENSFVISLLKVYSADGQAHENITVGNVSDWDVPAEDVPNNTSGVSASGGFTYMQGTDTTGVLSCQSNTTRFATEAFGGWYAYPELPCDFHEDYYGDWAGYQMLLEDTNLNRLGQPIDPPMPDGQAWWDDINDNPGNSGYVTVEDQAIWLTFKHNFTLGATDTLYFWTVYSTVRNGTLADLEAQVSYAKEWYAADVLGCDFGCCVGRVGDANGQGGDEPTIGDISVIIDALFITGNATPIACLAEADINQSGGPDPAYIDITIGDISILIDYLFITGPSLGLSDCL
jgi:hypothetical protein